MPGTDFNIRASEYSRQQTVQPAPAAAADAGSFGFGDFLADVLDIVNPLQHIPVISTIYRQLTGDKIGTPEKIAGDTLYGGLTGLISSVGDAIFTEVTGKSVGDTVYAFVFGNDDTPATAVAANDNAPAQTAVTEDTTVVAQAAPWQAAAAYRAGGRLLEAY